MKIIQITITIILALTLVGAVEIIAGESTSFDIGEVYDYYSIVGNSTEADLNITQTGTVVIIITNKYMKNDSFEIIFFNKEKEIITEHHYSGGGGGSSGKTKTKTIYKDKIVTIPGPSSEDTDEDDDYIGVEKRHLTRDILVISLIALLLTVIFLLTKFLEKRGQNEDKTSKT